jgi:hypothetical protein
LNEPKFTHAHTRFFQSNAQRICAHTRICMRARAHLVARNTAELSTLGENPASGSRSEMHGPPTHPPQPAPAAAPSDTAHGPRQGGAGSPASRAAVPLTESGPQTQPGRVWGAARWMADSSEAMWMANCGGGGGEGQCGNAPIGLARQDKRGREDGEDVRGCRGPGERAVAGNTGAARAETAGGSGLKWK